VPPLLMLAQKMNGRVYEFEESRFVERRESDIG
jgi:hypothetical protein